MTPESDVARLREAFAARDGGAAGEAECPDPGRIWDAAHGQLTAAERRTVVAHTTACPRCAEAWRLAAAIPTGEPSAAAEVPAARRPWLRWAIPAGVALAAAAAIAIVVIRPGGRRPPPGYRDPDPHAIRSLVPDGAALPRERFELRWRAVPGVRYDVRVFAADLTPIHQARDLAAPSYTVPAAALSGQPDGSTIYWQVEVRSPGAEPVPSAAFRVRVE